MKNTHLNIEIDENGKAKVTCSGDMAKIARAIVRLARHEEEFAVALNAGTIALRDHFEAIRVRDEMIGIINNKG